MFLFLRIRLNFWKASLAVATLFFISVINLPSEVIISPRYLNFFNSFICCPLLWRLHEGTIAFLDITIHSVFFTFKVNPISSLFSMVISKSLCRFSSESAIRTVDTLPKNCVTRLLFLKAWWRGIKHNIVLFSRGLQWMLDQYPPP